MLHANNASMEDTLNKIVDQYLGDFDFESIEGIFQEVMRQWS